MACNIIGLSCFGSCILLYRPGNGAICIGCKKPGAGSTGCKFYRLVKRFWHCHYLLFPGIVCFELFPNLKNPDEAYMTMVTNLFPAGPERTSDRCADCCVGRHHRFITECTEHCVHNGSVCKKDKSSCHHAANHQSWPHHCGSRLFICRTDGHRH